MTRRGRPVAIDLQAAKQVLLEAGASAASENASPEWIELVEKLSKECERAGVRTYIAFLGTAILAKAVDPSLDAFSVKSKTGGENAYSARSLAHGVLVPMTTELGINLGVTGREPLNNMPFFRMQRVDDDTPIHGKAAEAMSVLKEILVELNSISTKEEAGKALRAFLLVRRGYKPKYASLTEEGTITPDQLIQHIQEFVGAKSEGGRRAQAVVAGLLDVFAGRERVVAGRVNDPSRHYPGDVCVHEAGNSSKWEKAFEVRDKVVGLSDVMIFCERCLEDQVGEAVIVAISPKQPKIPTEALEAWSDENGVGVTIFMDWSDLTSQLMFWADSPRYELTQPAIAAIHARLIEVEASEQGVADWAAI